MSFYSLRRFAGGLALGLCLTILPTHTVNAQKLELASSQSHQLQKLLGEAEAKGEVNVIVTFNLSEPYRTESDLNSSDQALQRQQIAAANKEVARMLKGTGASIKREYASLPAMALRVDKKTLEFLSTSHLIAKVEEDLLHHPSLAQSSPLIGAPIA